MLVLLGGPELKGGSIVDILEPARTSDGCRLGYETQKCGGKQPGRREVQVN